MNIYFRLLKILKPFIKYIVAVFLLTFLYVFFNNLSLWVSVDFVQELFTTDIQQNVVSEKPSAVSNDSLANAKNKMLSLPGQSETNRFYERVKNSIKSVLIQDDKYETLLVVCLVIFLTFLFKNIVHFTRRILLDFVELKITVNLRNRMHNALMHLPLRYFEKKHTGEINSIIINDVLSINYALSTSFGKLILSPIQILANLVILFSISMQLSVITLTVIPVIAFITVKIGQSMRRKSRRMLEQNARMVATFQESVTGIRIVKAFTNEFREIQKFRHENNEYFKKNFKQRQLNNLTSPLNEVIYVLLVVFLLWYGGNLVYSHAGLGAEDFIRYLLFLFMMIQPIKDLSGVNNTIQTGIAAAQRVFSIMDEAQEAYKEDKGLKLEEFNKDIIFENVGFMYNDVDGYVLKNINLHVDKGEMVAFVGPSGAGKTTLINLLPRFYEVTEGSIKIDGVDIRRFNLKSLRAKMSIVTQDTILFNDTIRYNIAYGLDEVKEEDIIHAAKVANAWEFIEKMDEGLDTHIGERGVRLSGGQKQRISIARAILKNPPILILDEATSALDTESERLVQEAIDNLLKDRTVLVIAHRLSTIKNATKIVVMNKGQVEAVGRHEELMRKSGVYKNLYENQIIVTNSVS
ncbi:MAG TPA: ABC transporter ATP-binding protein [Caldithrix abyssi]|uniref:ABC transporter ATP-binding protein n=1 Tax=Caldithrix abyssi TaxID=187145 RepID=A0A7V4TZ89_CALAY|nr:ABC transporter ATP-binding protein [Caldithrix abyssi]